MCLKYNVNTSDSIKSYTGTSKKLKYFRKNSQNKLLSYRYMHFSLKIISVMSFLAWGQIKKLKRERKRERESLPWLLQLIQLLFSLLWSLPHPLSAIQEIWKLFNRFKSQPDTRNPWLVKNGIQFLRSVQTKYLIPK